MAAALADVLRHRVLGAAEPLHQRAIAQGLLDGVEVGALDVLDDGDLQRRQVVQLAHHHRHPVEAGLLRRAPAPLPGDDLELAGLAVQRPHQDRLQHALFADRGRQLVDLGLGEVAPRLVGVAVQQLDRDLVHAGARGLALAADRDLGRLVQ
jgi:hypothetical protein